MGLSPFNLSQLVFESNDGRLVMAFDFPQFRWLPSSGTEWRLREELGPPYNITRATRMESWEVRGSLLWEVAVRHEPDREFVVRWIDRIDVAVRSSSGAVTSSWAWDAERRCPTESFLAWAASAGRNVH